MYKGASSGKYTVTLLGILGLTRVIFSNGSVDLSGDKQSQRADRAAEAIAKASSQRGMPVWREAHCSQSDPGIVVDFSFSTMYSDGMP